MSQLPSTFRKIGRKRAAAGVPSYVPAGPVAEHIAELMRLGMSTQMVAQRAGVAPTTVRNISVGTYGQVRIRQAAAIMAADHLPQPHMPLVLAVGASRRLQALSRIGWQQHELARRAGMDPRQMTVLANQASCTWRRWKQVRDLYEELSMTAGPSRSAAIRARKQNWRAPLEWEGYDIDDPRVLAPLTDYNLADAQRIAETILAEVAQWKETARG